MNPAKGILLGFIGVALLYILSLLNVRSNCVDKAEKSDAVQVSDTTMLNIVEKAGNKKYIGKQQKITTCLYDDPFKKNIFLN